MSNPQSALASFRRDLAGLRERLRWADVSEVVTIGAVLWEISRLARSGCDEAKVRLRRHHTSTLPGKTVYKGEGSATATLTVSEGLNLAPGVNVTELRRALGPDFDKIFRVNVSLQPGAAEVILALPEPARSAAMAAVVQQEDSTPRVVFSS